VRRAVFALIAVYIGIVLLMWTFQERFIFPGHDWQGQKWTLVQPSADRELIPLKTSLGDSIYVLFQKAAEPLGAIIRADASSRPTILFFYGGGGTIAGSIDLLSRWRAMGLNVAVVEYPGYGMSGGTSSESAFYAAADAAYDHLIHRLDIDRTKLIIAGQSLGTGVAVDLASRKPVAALALFSPYTNITAMAHVEYPWLPTSFLLRHFFRSDQKIGFITAPILIAHGDHDRTIPVQMSHALAATAKQALVNTVFVDADHNDLFDRAANEMDGAMHNLVGRLTKSP